MCTMGLVAKIKNTIGSDSITVQCHECDWSIECKQSNYIWKVTKHEAAHPEHDDFTVK